MYLVTAATDFEMKPFKAAFTSSDIDTLVTGIGPVETTCRLAYFLSVSQRQVQGVVNFGVAGAYVDPEVGAKAELLDICLAEKEILGDLGICLGDRIEKIKGKGLEAPDTFVMDGDLLQRASQILQANEIPFHRGNFITVNCTTGTAERGTMLGRQYNGLCENMEGAAVARACRELDVPCLEIRCISNLVEDRDTSRWKLQQACRRAADTTSLIVQYLLESSHE